MMDPRSAQDDLPQTETVNNAVKQTMASFNNYFNLIINLSL